MGREPRDIALARRLRGNPPEPERRMWAVLHALRQQGYHFRRQVQIGPYFVEFACHHAGLAIEVDGITHVPGNDKDTERDALLRARGFTVLRFWNADVMANPEGVYHVIAAALANSASPTPVPSPQGGGRRRSRKRGGRGTKVDGEGLPPPCGEGTGVGDDSCADP